MRLWPILAGATVLGGLMLMGGAAVAMPSESPTTRPRGSDLRPTEQDELWRLSRQVEAMGVLPGWAEFTQPSAWIESRFNPEAGSSKINNAARGWLGGRPESMFNWKNDLTHLQNQPNLLKNRKWAVAMAADYAYRIMRDHTASGQTITMADLRRGFSLPYRIHQKHRAGGAANLAQFREAIEAVGANPNLPNKQITIGNWPGVQAVLNQLGAPSP